MKGYIVDTDYTEIDGKTFVQIFGRLENGESFVVLNEFIPYFFIKKSDKAKLKDLLDNFEVREDESTSFSGEKVLRVIGKSQTEMNKLIHEIHEGKYDTFEADIKPHIRYIIDNNLKGSIEIDGEYENSERVDRVYRDAKVFPANSNVKLKVLSIDIESCNKDLYCIGMYSKNYEKVFFISKQNVPGTISCKDESDCLEKFKEEVVKFDPDIITGWNLVDFDLKFLSDAFKKNKIPFDIARTNENVKLKIQTGFFRKSSASVVGRQIIDGLELIKDPFIQEAPSIKSAKFESYTLENVAQQILGTGKLIKGDNRHLEIERLYTGENVSDLKKLADYNLMDCKLVYDILEKTKMIELAVERSHLTGMTMDKLTASIAAFDSVYIREARKKGFVSPSLRFGEKEEKLKGGYVYSAGSGIFNNILILDFKSLYPSIIKTFNIDPASYIGTSPGKEENVIESPNKAYFKNSSGILPEIIGELHKAREKAKKEKRELSSYAIKIIMNSFWGVLATPNCRYFDFDMASAITAFARNIIQMTAKKIEEKGDKVIYSDTDSVFVKVDMSSEKANERGVEIQNNINDFYKKYVKEIYNRDSYLDIEFKKQYTSMMIPDLRMKAKASEENEEVEEVVNKSAKKRYAGLVWNSGAHAGVPESASRSPAGQKEELEIVGLEAIRGDWTEAAQEFQRELLMRVFKKQEHKNFIKDYVDSIRKGKLDDKLLYRKSIRKDLTEYTKTTPPHVKAARMLDVLDSNIIEYFITVKGPQPKQKLKDKLDYDHYIEKQIKPIANQVLGLLGEVFEDVAAGSKQKKLF
jgi:DNA polymerase-2